MSQENQQTNQQGTTTSQTSDQSGAAQQGGQAGQTQQGQSGGQHDGGATTAPPAPTGLSADQISALVKSAVGEVAQQAAPRESQEEMLAKFEKAFNVHKFDPKAFAQLGYSEEQLEQVAPFFEALRDGLVRQAVTMSNYQIGLLREELLKQFQPALDVAQRQLEERLKSEFLEAHKDLRGYEPLLEEIKNRLVSEKRQFKSKEELFTTISTEARSIIDKVFKATGQQQQSGNGGSGAGGGNAQQQQTHRMSTVATGGQGGAGGATGQGQSKPGWLQALE